jgi:tetratricopeptide (TPR) repeat protein
MSSPAPELPPDQPEAHAPAPVARRSGVLKRALALSFGLLCASAPVASAVYFWTKPEPVAEEKPKPVSFVESVHADAIDDLIRAGAFTEALTACQRPGPPLPAPKSRARMYREALCLEALGRVKEADELYQKAAPEEGDRGAWARAMLGRARCALATDDLAGAQKYLDRVALQSGHPDCAGGHIVEECAFLRGRLAAVRLGAVRALDPLDPEAVAWPGLGGALDLYFDWLPPDTLPATSSGLAAGPSAFEARRSATGFDITAHATERPTAEALGAIAEAAGLKLQMDESAAAELTKDVTAIDVRAMPLEDVLAALLGSSGLGWKLDGEVLTLTPTTAPARDVAEKALRHSLAVAPTHPRVAAVKVWLANFDFAAGRLRDASKGYQELLDAAPVPSEAPYAAYNIGLTELRQGTLASARSRFIDLVDRAPRTKWGEYGWWWAGRINLDTGDTVAAKKAFHAAGNGKTREIQSAVALGVCACELLEGNDDAAREALEDSRVASRGSHMALWTAFEGLLRYRAAPTESRLSAMLTALREAGDGAALGPGGMYLAGRVYRGLEMPDRMAALYDRATESIRGPLAIRMTFDAGAWYDLSERFELARTRYRAVAATDPKGLGPQADLRLAAMALRAGNTDECLRRCRGLLDRSGIDRDEVLKLMGRGYEVKRNYRLAAECFAGRVPPE